MAPFTALPVECVVNILLFLTPTDIRRCREISRPLLTAIRESRELQYLLELDALGYAVPLNPLTGLPLDSKIRILKEHHSKTGTLELSPDSRVNVGVAPMGSNYQFSRGVFARGGPTLDTTRRLAIYQSASQNKQTKESDYVLPDLGINAQNYRLDPDLDLLVLLEVDSNPIDPGTDVQMRFHLRSLATGLPHPLALVHTITGNFKFSSTYYEPAFQIVGRLLAIFCHTSFRLDVSPPSLSIWDWTTGDLVVSTDIAGRHFAFISEDTFIVPFDRRKWAGQDIVGSLEVYTISEGRVSHVASLHLPATPDRPCHSSSQILFTPPAPSSGFPSTPPARIYEMGPKGHYTCLQLRAFNIQLMDAEMASGSLFIPSSTILDVLRAKVPLNPTDRSRVHISWEDWSTGTTWVNNRHARGNRSCVFGHRVALLVFRQELKAWEVLVYDLRRKAKEEGVFGYMQRADEYLDGVFEEAGRPLIVASFLITPDVIPWDGRAGDNPPEIMLDDEHVFVFKVSSQFRIGAQMAIDLMIQEAPTNEESTIYVYTL